MAMLVFVFIVVFAIGIVTRNRTPRPGRPRQTTRTGGPSPQANRDDGSYTGYIWPIQHHRVHTDHRHTNDHGHHNGHGSHYGHWDHSSHGNYGDHENYSDHSDHSDHGGHV